MKLGNCYEVHGKAISLDEVEGLLCHGIAWHPLTGWHGHCWIELNEDVVMDFSNKHQAVLRRERYYKIGKVKNVKRYTASEARELMLKTHSFGPWNK